MSAFARKLALQLRAGDVVFLEGEMGAGKTTFARALLQALEIDCPPEGSPTFAIAHDYGKVVHTDFYRIASEDEIEERGLPEYFNAETIVISEWISLWDRFRASVLRSGRCWEVRIAFSKSKNARDLEIRQLSDPR